MSSAPDTTSPQQNRADADEASDGLLANAIRFPGEGDPELQARGALLQSEEAAPRMKDLLALGSGGHARAAAPGFWAQAPEPGRGTLADPANVDFLESEPLVVDEGKMMTAIQRIMVEQKRETSRKSLPELTPAGFGVDLDVTPVARPSQATDARAKGHRTPWSRLTSFARRYGPRHPLAWMALAAVVLISPRFVLHLVVASALTLLLLLVLYGPSAVLYNVPPVARAWARVREVPARFAQWRATQRWKANVQALVSRVRQVFARTG